MLLIQKFISTTRLLVKAYHEKKYTGLKQFSHRKHHLNLNRKLGLQNIK